MKPTRAELDDMVKHMFNCAGDLLALAEQALGRVDKTCYAKETKQDIKVHLSQDIIRLLELIRPANDYMQSQMPEHAEKIERWKILDEKIIPAEIEKQLGNTLIERPEH